MRTVQLAVLWIAVLALNSACTSGGSSFSVLPEEDTFMQSSGTFNGKMDILFMIDQSGSMLSSQTNLGSNFPVFIDGFTGRGFDFRIAVATTDSFLALPTMSSIYTYYQANFPSYFVSLYEGLPASEKARFRDGVGSTHTGVFLITPSTPNLNNVFVTNILQGTDGFGDERPLQSLKTSLQSPLNPGFLRPDSFLAVIIVTDEDDFSHNGTNYLNGQYTNPALHTVQSYVDFLDTFTSSVPESRRYSVSSIAIDTAACRSSLGGGERRVGQRVNELADLTGGVKASLCGDFATELELISDNILSLSTQFYLSRIPIPETIRIWINGVEVPPSGFTYNSASNSIIFQPAYIPAEGSTIQVYFDPVSLGG